MWRLVLVVVLALVGLLLGRTWTDPPRKSAAGGGATDAPAASAPASAAHEAVPGQANNRPARGTPRRWFL